MIETQKTESRMDLEMEIQEHPKSYYSLTSKERLLLLFAENFRQQYRVMYPNRKPCVLAVKNECEIEVKVRFIPHFLHRIFT